MAKRYTATVQLRCAKQHTCAGCGGVYAYILERKISGTGASPEQASAAMRKTYLDTQRTENDLHPCPACGHYQPDMIGLRLARVRAVWAGFAVIMPILIPILCGTYAVQSYTLTWVAVIYCAAALLLQYLAGKNDPNRDLEANRRLAADRIAAGVIQYQPPPNARNPNLLPLTALPRPAQSLAHTVTFILLLGAVVLAVAPELLRALGGWPLNAQCYPAVVGPGDATRVYMADSITSIKGYWRGRPHVTFDAGDGQRKDIAANTNDNDWGSSIYAKSDEETNNSHPWVELNLPDDPGLAGKTLACKIELNVEFPQMAGSSTFQTVQRQMGRDLSLQLASRGAGARYNTAWWTCTVLALSIVFVGSIVLVFVARAYQRQAKPAVVLPAPAA